MDTREFFDALYGQAIGEDAQLCIWTIPDKRSKWFTETESAAIYALAQAERREVYYGVGLRRAKIHAGRGKSNDVTQVTTLWADIDYGATHQSKAYPPTEDDAMKLVSEPGVPPSIVVRSGHGLHAYWLLSEALGPEDGIASLLRRWGMTLNSHAKVHGWTLDCTSDLARVLRVPGTINYKFEQVQPVEVISDDCSRKYHYHHFDSVCVMDEFDHASPEAVVKIGPLTIDMGADPPLGKLQVLMVNEPRFRETWEGRRKPGDGSPSACELSMVDFAEGLLQKK